MKAQQFKEMSAGELAGKLKELKQEYFNLRFQHATGQLEDANKLNFIRKDIARCMTEIREREIKGVVEAVVEQPKKKARGKAK